MKKLLVIFTCLIVNISFSQVGINTVNPTNMLHVKATENPLRLEGVQNSKNANDYGVRIGNDGVITKTDNGIKFVGHIKNDITFVAYPVTPITKIIVNEELLDIGGNYNTTTGIFKATVTGTYLYEIQITTKPKNKSKISYKNIGTVDTRAIAGFVNASTNKWIGRFNFELYRDARATYCKGIVKLEAGKSYYFGITSASIVGNGANDGSILIANPTGATGTGEGTMFAITKIK